MEKGFIKNYDLIQEKSSVPDLLDFSETVAAFTERLHTAESPAIIGLIGKFGTGKSTMLFQIQKEAKEKGSNEIWVNFDAWKYPERKELWDGFVLDFADQVGCRKEAKEKTEGKDTKSKTLDFIAAIAKDLHISALGNFIKQYKSSPATRVFEIQQILSEIINEQKRSIYIVIEDIDRSGDAGVFFLETLKQFLNSSRLNTRITAIVPIGEKSFSANEDSYFKCLDYIEFFEPSVKGFGRFVESVFNDDLFEGVEKYSDGRVAWTGKNKKGQITTFLEELLKRPSMTIRHIKTILRKADLVYRHQYHDGHEPDWRVTICFEASKYLHVMPDSDETFFELFRREKLIRSNTLFASFLLAMIRNLPSVYDTKKGVHTKDLLNVPANIGCIPKVQGTPSWPWGHHDYSDVPAKEELFVSDFYLGY